MENVFMNCNKHNIMWVLDKNIEIERIEAEYYKPEYVQAMEKIENSNGMILKNLILEVKDGPGGWGISTSDYVDSGVPMLRGINIQNGLLTLDGCVYITEVKQNELKRSRVVKNDVLLAVRGSAGVGKSAVYSLEQQANMNAAVVKITVDETFLDPYYLSCFFKFKIWKIANGENCKRGKSAEYQFKRSQKQHYTYTIIANTKVYRR